MAEPNYTSVGVGNNLTIGTIDPLDRGSLNLMAKESELIEYFVQGQKQAISTEKLRLEYTETSIRLSDNHAQLIGISKQVNQWQRKVLISNNSDYRSALITALVGAGFIARQKSSHPEFTEYHHYQIPAGYKLNYTEVIQLWRTWWHNRRYQLNVKIAPIDISVFSKGNWSPVRDLQPKQGSFVLLTARGEITIDAAEYIVWIDRSDPNIAAEVISSKLNLPIDDRSLVTNSNLEYRDLPAQPASIKWSPEPDEYIDLEAYLSTFNTEDSEDIDRIEGIYNIDELLSGSNIIDRTPPPPPKSPKLPSQPSVVANPVSTTASSVEPPTKTQAPAATPTTTQPPLSISQKQAALKLKVINVLETYLQQGDRIVRTEVLKNAQGQEINRKVTNIQRGCPSWAIDQIKKISPIES
jgi:hypothetical protein